MENLIDAIRTAVASEASSEARSAGADACRTILAALEGQRSAPLAQSPHPAAALQTAIAMLRGIPVDQLLDVAITRIKAALPPGAVPDDVQRLNIPLVIVPQLGGGK